MRIMERMDTARLGGRGGKVEIIDSLEWHFYWTQVVILYMVHLAIINSQLRIGKDYT